MARVDARKHPLRERFEAERKRAAFLSFLAGMGIGIIAFDTWIAPWSGFVGGLAVGGVTYAVTFGYETLMWRKHHG